MQQAAKSRAEAHRHSDSAVNVLAAIDAAIAMCTGNQFKAHALLVYLSAHVPPKENGAVFAEMVESLNRNSKEDIKKALKKALRHYNPDKNGLKYGPDWLWLCNEITQRINYFKDVSPHFIQILHKRYV